MKKQLLALSGILVASCMGPAAAQESKVCLSGVCMGATLAEIPTNIRWEQIVQIDPKRINQFFPDWPKILPANIKASPAVIKELEPYRGPTGVVEFLNGKAIAALMKIRGACYLLNITGKFKSESGHETEVTIKTYPSPDGSTQQIRVSQLSRHYNDVRSDAERSKLAEQLEAQFHVPVHASYLSKYNGQYGRDVREATDDEPRVKLEYNMLGGSNLMIFEPKTMASVPDTDIFRRFPGCAQPQKID